MAPPSPQSAQVAATGGVPRNESALERQPRVFRSHHAGYGGTSKWRSIRDSIDSTLAMPLVSTNEATSNSVPVFVSQAKLRFWTPPSPPQAFHFSRRFPAKA